MLLILLLCFQASKATNMNLNGLPYQISNALGPFSTDLEAMSNGQKVEHFDVYGEVRTLFSQVYWTLNNPIHLPPALVERFKGGKIMAITGYEVDQVTHSGPQIGSTSTKKKLGGFACYPDCSETDTSIPSYMLTIITIFHGWWVQMLTSFLDLMDFQPKLFSKRI